MAIFLALAPGIYTIYEISTGDDENCLYALSAIDSTIAIWWVIGGITAAIKLRNVHDAYFLKKQLKAVGIVTLVLAFPWLVIGFFGIIDALWWQAYWVPFTLLIEFMYFGMPSILLIRERRRHQ